MKLNAKQRKLRRRKIMHYVRPVLDSLFFGAFVALIIWVILSYFDVTLHNHLPNPVYQSWNFFTLIF